MVGGRASGGGSGYTAAASSRPQRLAERKWTWEPPSAGRGWQPRQPPDVGGEGGETLGPRRQRETWVGGRDEGEGDTSAPAASPSEVAAAVAAHLRSLAGHNRRACRRVVAAAGHEGAKQIFLANVGALHRGEAFLEQAARELDALGFQSLCEDLLLDTGGGEIKDSTARGGSETASGVAMLRHVGFRLGFGPDRLAHLFLASDKQLEENINLGLQEFKMTGSLPGIALLGGTEAARAAQRAKPHLWMDMLSLIQVRTCFLDDVVEQFAESYGDARCNIVLLGAGFDMRLHRLPLPGSACLFEVDAAGTQRAKIELLSSVAPELLEPGKVTYVESDLRSNMWLEELQSAGLRPEDPTLVIWEGVSMYMDRDAVEAVLASVGGSSPLVGPAALAFDFASRTMLEEDTGLVAQMAAIGEPLLFGAEPDEMAAMVEASGLEVLDLLSPFEGLRRYLPVRSTDGESVGLGGTTEFLMVSGNGKMTEPRQLA